MNILKLPVAYVKFRFSNTFYRTKTSLGLWHEDITTDIKLKIENHWSYEVLCKQEEDTQNDPFYVLPMFPYPSGNLHMGHVRVYSISDTIARFHKLDGKHVIHPIGWDAFGLPAENAAIERCVQPDQWTVSNINSMKKQLLSLGIDFDWSREISTCEPNYYKWTQFIFLKLFEQGLAYQNKATVNWDPVDQTVLADEQVDDLGCSWRSGAKVEKKYLCQWFIRTTKFAELLYNGLTNTSLENWKDIINLQKHWLGECDGVVVTFKLLVGDKIQDFDVWTSQPYKLIHGKFLTISRNNVMVRELSEHNIENLKAINPITDSEIPIYISDNDHYSEGRDIYIASPSTDKKDYELAESLNISYAKTDDFIEIASENKKSIDIAKFKKVGGHLVSSRLKDWLISRQRYWGTPIPIIHCPKCGSVPVPYDDLPVKLPECKASVNGIRTLAEREDWVNCKCPRCQSNAKRETDTMDTFVDSSWYYYRFLDPKNEKMPFEKHKLVGKIPVHIYIGGKEHAVLHLYYARFMSYFLHSLGWTSSQEPFKRLLVQGMVMGQSYKVKSSGKYIPADCVERVGNNYKEKSTGEDVLVQWEKMSKSKHNGENPKRLLSTYGCDTTRLLMLANVPPATSRHWSDETLPGVLNWQHRLWRTIAEYLKHRNNVTNSNLNEEDFRRHETILWQTRNYLVATTTYHFKYTQKLSVGISRMQSLTSTLRNNVPPEVISNSKEFEIALASLIIMLAPVTPHFCSELWAGFLSAPNRICKDTRYINWDKNVLEQRWPIVDDQFDLSYLCKVDGINRCELKIKACDLADLKETDAVQMMLKQESVEKRIKRGIHKTKLEIYPECRAILHVFTNRKQQTLKAVQNV